MAGARTWMHAGAALAMFGLAACAQTPATVAGSAKAEPASPAAVSAIRRMGDAVSESRLKADVEALAGFGTRHTLSEDVSDTRGVGAARRWVAAQFQEIGNGCGGCIEVVTPSGKFQNNRVPVETEVFNVVGIKRGAGDPQRVILISAHLDSRVSDVMNSVSDAPGANDDASGVAAVIEAARILSKEQLEATVVFAALTGEEQGLLGAQAMAKYAADQGWRVEAVLNNDIIGNTEGYGGRREDGYVRIFSEGVRAAETPEMANARLTTGGELDSPSRNLARRIASVADAIGGLDVMMVYRRDRFGRGGDQIPMQQAGYPAVRLSEAVETYTRQHQDLRTVDGVVYGDTIDGVDFDYLARVTRLNVAAMAELAKAPAPPSGVKLGGAVSADTAVSWTASPGAASYRVWKRSTTSPEWTDFETAPGDATSLTLKTVAIDDWFFGVSAVSADGHESPVAFAGPVGEFFPPAK
jgi:hypothetical protein